jgi:hypothetical protein
MKKVLFVLIVISLFLSVVSISLSVYNGSFDKKGSSEELVEELDENTVYERCAICNANEQSARKVRIVGKELASNYKGSVEEARPAFVFKGEILDIEKITSDIPGMGVRGVNVLFSVDKYHYSGEDPLVGKSQFWVGLSNSPDYVSFKIGETHTMYLEYEEEDFNSIGDKNLIYNSSFLID